MSYKTIQTDKGLIKAEGQGRNTVYRLATGAPYPTTDPGASS